MEDLEVIRNWHVKVSAGFEPMELKQDYYFQGSIHQALEELENKINRMRPGLVSDPDLDENKTLAENVQVTTCFQNNIFTSRYRKKCYGFDRTDLGFVFHRYNQFKIELIIICYSGDNLDFNPEEW